MTAPAAGATVSATTTVTASAADNVGVAGVQFLLDGANLGAEDTTAPYSVPWDTTGATNGSHSLTARARDAAGNRHVGGRDRDRRQRHRGPSGLAAYAFDEGAGTTAADASGNGSTGTLTGGATWSVGKYGTAVQLDGNDDYVNLGNPTGLRLTGSMTVSAWIYSAAFPADDAAIVSKRSGTEVGYQLDTTTTGAPDHRLQAHQQLRDQYDALRRDYVAAEHLVPRRRRLRRDGAHHECVPQRPARQRQPRGNGHGVPAELRQQREHRPARHLRVRVQRTHRRHPRVQPHPQRHPDPDRHGDRAQSRRIVRLDAARGLD